MGGFRKGKIIIFWFDGIRVGAWEIALFWGGRVWGSWFFRDRAGIFLTRLRVKKHRMFIRCEIVQEQLLTSKLDGAVSARFRAVLNF